jgi:hypothetical protein
MSSLRKQEVKLGVEAKISELRAQLATLAADGAQAHLKGGWEKITDQVSSKLNQWLKG